MNEPQYILLPASRWFIYVSLAVAFALDLLPWGRLPGVPDWVALTLLFWNLHQPRKVGIGIAFALGILIDVHEASLFGEHALAYTLLSYGAISIHRRVLPLPFWVQAVYVLPLLVVTEIIPFVIRLATGAPFPGWTFLMDGVVEAIVWPVVAALLIAPQRRATDPDDTRPI
ncbi:rod shape-determining protein MreD [Chitinasiproducens palmae]|nr:rod shape-determining protein MreD [Chitinasiproducens palmae]